MKNVRNDRAGKATADLHRPTWLIALFIAPTLLLYVGIFVYPMAKSFWYALFQGSPEAGTLEYVGLDNFKRLLFHDRMFWRCVAHNLEFVVFAGTGTIVLALALALGLTYCGPRSREFFRIVYLFPNVMAVVAVAILWSFVYNPSFGLLNGMLRGLHLDRFAHAWLGEPNTTMPALIVVQIWMHVGFYVVLFYAGLLRIPADYLEAARIDGASVWQEFIHVRMPLLAEILRIAVIYVIINMLGIFALVFMVNEGQTSRYNNVLLTYMYEQGFRNGNFGYACAIAVTMVVLVLATVFGANLAFGQAKEELS